MKVKKRGNIQINENPMNGKKLIMEIMEEKNKENN